MAQPSLRRVLSLISEWLTRNPETRSNVTLHTSSDDSILNGMQTVSNDPRVRPEVVRELKESALPAKGWRTWASARVPARMGTSCT
jgi:hypothetical protein